MELRSQPIWVRLLDEGTEVSKLTQGYPLGDNVFIVLKPADYDPSDEVWEFIPGSVVRCRSVTLNGKTGLQAFEED